MAKSISDEDKKKVLELVAQDFTYNQVADQMGWTHSSRKGTVANIVRDSKKNFTPKEELKKVIVTSVITLDQMSKEERYKYLKDNITKTPRGVIIFSSFSGQEKDFFIDEYFKILQSTDSLNEVEEQQLFSACVEFILAYRVLSLKSEEEKCYAETMQGLWKQGDPRYRAFLDERFQKEYVQHTEAYRKFITDLKMSRAQRLDKIKNEKRTLVDLATELSNKSAQSQAADEIVRLSKETDEELKRMIESGYLFGVFEE